MKENNKGSLRRASDAFFATIQRRNNTPIIEVLVPVEYNKTNVVIITTDNQVIYQPDKAWHEFRRRQELKAKQKIQPRERLSRKAHQEQCDKIIDIRLESYYAKAKQRVQKGYSKDITNLETERRSIKL